MTKISNLYSLSNFLTVNSSGNIVIAAPSSGYALDVNGALRYSVSRTNGTNTNALVLSDNLTGISTVGYGTRIVGYSNGTGVQSVIGFENGGTGTNNESQLSFYTQNVANSLVKQLTIGSTGIAHFSTSIGIGVASPTGKLSIYGNEIGSQLTFTKDAPSGAYGRLGQDSNGTFLTQNAKWDGSSWTRDNTGGIPMALALHNGNGRYEFRIAANGTNPISWTTAMIIDSTGTVGIGTTSAPSRLLEVASGGDAGYIRVTGNRGNADGVHVGNIEFYNSYSSRLVGEVKGITGVGGTQSDSGQLAFYTNNSGSYAERMRIAAGGNVGIGTTSILAKLTVQGNLYAIDGNIVVANGNQTANTASAIINLGNKGYFGDPNVGAASIQAISAGTYWYSGTALAFFTNPGPDATGTSYVERMRILPGGAIYSRYGQSGTTAREDITANLVLEGKSGIASGRAGISLLSNGSAYGIIMFGSPNSTNTDGYIQYKNDDRSLNFGSADNLRLTITSAGDFKLPWANNRLASMMEYDNDYRMGLFYQANARTLTVFSTGSDGGGSIAFNTRGTASSGSTDYGVERMKINPSGNITTPYQPAFMAYGNGNNIAANGTYLIYPTVHLNRGGHYNASTGVFTAPVSGVYLFSWTAIGNSNSDVYRWFLRVNDSNFLGDVQLRQDTLASGSEYAQNGNRTVLANLTAGNTVRIYFTSDGGTTPYGNNDAGNAYLNFMGYLIG